MLIDTHCHLTADTFASDLDAVIGRIRQANVQKCILIGTGVDDARAALALTQKYPDILYHAAGIDPFTAHDKGPAFDDELAQLEKHLKNSPAVALGEIGLDYHYDLDPKPVQRDRFSQQLALAEKLNLPVVIHVREAHEDMAAVLGEFPRVRGVIHSFTGTRADAERYIKLDWHIAFNGIITFKNADSIREAATIVPDERLLVETDSPYLAPVPYRGKRCEPAYVVEVAKQVATVRNSTLDAIAQLTTTNAQRLFQLK